MKFISAFGLLLLQSLGLAQGIGPDTPLTKQLADQLYDTIGSGSRTRYPLPPNWTGSSVGFTIFESASGRFYGDLNANAIRPPDYPTYSILYVDWQKGSDQNTGLSKLSPLKKISVALQKPGNKWILCRPGTYDFRSSWNGVTPVGNILIEPWDETGYVFSSTQMDNVSWVAEGSSYTTITSTTATQVIDEKVRDQYGVGARLTRVSSAEAVNAQPGTFYATSKRMWVHTSDSRVPDGQILPFCSLGNGRFGGGSLWARGIVFLGGPSAFTGDATGFSGTSTYTFADCFFKYAVTGDGYNVAGPVNSTLFHCGATGNAGDGFEYKNGTKFIEMNSAACANGISTNSENNGSSSSGACEGLIIGGQYCANYGRNVNYFQNSKVMMFGSLLGGSRATGNDSVDLGCGKDREDTSAIWALGLVYETGSQYCRAVSTNGIIWSRKHGDSRADLLGGKDRIKPI